MERPFILVVEDNWTQRKVIELLSEEYGFAAVIVGTCAEAMQALRENQVYSLILLDIRLPDTSGFECAAGLRQLCSKHEIPIVAMTGLVRDNNEQLYADSGLDDYLQKPFTAREFREMVLKWTRREGHEGNVYQFPHIDHDQYSG